MRARRQAPGVVCLKLMVYPGAGGGFGRGRRAEAGGADGAETRA
eukprot:COSAG03_NODE_502_length_7397_cov_43.776469_5_plen_44_part_00